MSRSNKHRLAKLRAHLGQDSNSVQYDGQRISGIIVFGDIVDSNKFVYVDDWRNARDFVMQHRGPNAGYYVADGDKKVRVGVDKCRLNENANGGLDITTF